MDDSSNIVFFCPCLVQYWFYRACSITFYKSRTPVLEIPLANRRSNYVLPTSIIFKYKSTTYIAPSVNIWLRYLSSMLVCFVIGHLHLAYSFYLNSTSQARDTYSEPFSEYVSNSLFMTAVTNTKTLMSTW